MPDASAELKWYGDRVSSATKAAAGRAVFRAAAALLQEANKKCPHRTGLLQSSGRADLDEDGPVGWVSYNTPYAVRLHEHPEYRFGEGREGRWLANAFERLADRLTQYIAAGVREALG